MLPVEMERVPQEAKCIFLCIDEWQKGVPSGRLYGLKRSHAHCFAGAIPMLRAMDSLLDQETRAARFETNRSLRHKSNNVQAISLHWSEQPQRPGQMLTLAVRVLFRQNSTWQGEARWIEGGQSRCFRSALELMFMIDDLMVEYCANSATS